MSLRQLFEVYQFFWTLEANAQQRLAWEDAEEARAARARAESTAKTQAKAMLDANPSGQLGASRMNDEQRLKDAGLL
jgi:hypothetical protein